MAVYEINDKKGGMTTAMLNRSKMFYDSGYEADIVTFDFNPDYDSIRTKLIKSKKMDERTNILNLHEDLKNENTKRKSINKKIYNQNVPLKEANKQEAVDSNNPSIVRYFSNGIYEKYKKYDKKGNLKVIDFFNETRQRTKRIKFNSNKSVQIIFTYDPIHNKVNSERYYTNDGYCYLVKWYSSNSENPISIFLFDRETKTTYQFKNNNELATHWLTVLCRKRVNKQKPILICDGPGSLPKILNVSNEVAKRISFIHINHYNPPYTLGSTIKENHRFIFERIDQLEALVILTHKQREDVEAEFGKHHNIFVLPNSQPINNLSVYKKDQNKVSMFTRLHFQKGIDRAIKMFKLVVEKNPDAILEIYGSGSEEESLNTLIKECSLENNVKLMGYSKDVRKEMAQSCLTILTSRYEAFGLSITESLEAATPVVSFDCNYGPSDVIKDSKTGFLIPDGDIKMMAEKVLFLLNNPDIAVEMGKNGRKDMIEAFSDEIILQKWENLIASI